MPCPGCRETLPALPTTCSSAPQPARRHCAVGPASALGRPLAGFSFSAFSGSLSSTAAGSLLPKITGLRVGASLRASSTCWKGCSSQTLHCLLVQFLAVLILRDALLCPGWYLVLPFWQAFAGCVAQLKVSQRGVCSFELADFPLCHPVVCFCQLCL